MTEAVEKKKNEIHEIRTLTLIYDVPVNDYELPLFRGAVIHALKQPDLLFHNHSGDTYRYAYPLVQYKRIEGKGALVCLDEGADSMLASGLVKDTVDLLMGRKEVKASLETMKLQPFNLIVGEDGDTDARHCYRMRQWIPLSSDNYRKYRELAFIDEKIAFLEKTLVANILAMAKGLGIFLNKRITVRIRDLSEPYLTAYKKVKLDAFDLVFETNISLPLYIGLGKKASLDCGVITEELTN